MSRTDRQIGDKLGPRLVQLVVHAVLATRRQLAPIDAKIHAAATQQVIDRAGLEVAELFGPILEKITEGQDLPDWLSDHVEQVKSGQHQWKAIAGVLGMTGAMTPISVALNNFLAAGVRELVALDPLLVPDPATLAQLSNMGLIAAAEALFAAEGQGINAHWFTALELAAQQLPGMSEIQDLSNRGLISDNLAFELIQQAGVRADIQQTWWEAKEQLLSPADAALAVLRGHITMAQGVNAAARTGLSAANFATMIANTGEPPAIEEMISLWRRNLITKEDLIKAILQSRVNNEWVPAVLQMGIIPPTPAEALHAYLQGQISRDTSLRRFTEGGGDPTWFQDAFNSEGSAPTPVEASVMANRGIMPWTGKGPAAVTYEQAFLEGQWRNKWSAAFRKMAEYLPPPREVSTLVKEGALTQDEALHLWEKEGLSPATAHLYWKAAHYTKTAHTHNLAVSQILRLYHDKAISVAEAKAMLKEEGWADADITYMLEIEDLQRETAYLEKAISKVSGLYIAYKITSVQAAAAMSDLGIEGAQTQHLLKTWTLERTAAAKQLTSGEVINAWFYTIITTDDAIKHLEQLGYAKVDAWTLLAIRAHGPLPGTPAGG